ncbi:MAG: four helix bundle protein [Bacteroidia bacterium]|nr:four helix bundle protein [Bacteroidia bacterium]
MTRTELQNRTKKFNIDIINICDKVIKTTAGYEVARQLIRSAGSVGANYRAVCRAKSQDDFIYKLQIVLEETDESLYWLEIIEEAKLSDENLEKVKTEANELISIFSSADKTAKANRLNKNK